MNIKIIKLIISLINIIYLINNDINYDMIKEIIEKNYNELYNIIIYLWIDLIHNN